MHNEDRGTIPTSGYTRFLTCIQRIIERTGNMMQQTDETEGNNIEPCLCVRHFVMSVTFSS